MMAGMEICNDAVMVKVFDDTKVNFQLVADGTPDGRWLTRRKRLIEASADILGDVPYLGIYYYSLPTIYESLTVRKGGEPRPFFDAKAGELPELLDDADLDMYPCLHFLAHKRVAAPWRIERWYTLVGPYMIFECQQYFERPAGEEKSPLRAWERIISELHQVVDVAAWGTDRDMELHSVIRGRPRH
ncbi:MAG: hypothetical protein L6435_12960 [Anaerolineae bacterium]|nr:hypothetical protein [Anaerolineae bacterium]